MNDQPLTVSGTVGGPVVQASTIQGGVHFHTQRPPTVVPRQLPASVRHFVGRAEQLAELNAHLDSSVPGAVSISTIEGMAGIGKSALVIQWAHANASRFPDGQLYVNLRGFSLGAAMQPGEALWGFLHALGVPTDAPSLDLDAQASVYRSLLADRRMLIVLDNARDSEQVLHLLPGTDSCHVLVTSRHRLTGLVASAGARAIALDGLTGDESTALLSKLLGEQRIAAEPDATGALIEHCSRLPLALAILGGRVAGNPCLPLGALASRLGEARLDSLDTGEVDVSTVFSWSYEALDPSTAAVFRLMSLHPGPDFDLPAAAATAGVSLAAAERLVSGLTRAHLLEHRPGGRYGFHDLVRLYARDRASGDDLRLAVQRMLDHYLHMCIAADAHLGSPWEPVGTADSGAIGNAGEAMAWFTAEHAVLVGIVEHVPSDEHTWRIACTMVTYLDRQGHWRDFVTTQRMALAAAGSDAARALSHRLLARALIRQEEFDEARDHLHAALRLFSEAQDVAGQAHTYYALGYLEVRARNRSDAQALTSRALALSRASGQQIWEAKALNNIGWCHLEFANYAEALPHSQQALDLFRALDADPDGQAHTLECLGSTHLGLGQPAEALRCYSEALLIREALGNHYTQARTLCHIALAHRVTGDVELADNALRHALTILDRLGHPDAVAIRAELS